MADRVQVVATARGWVGVVTRHQGRSRGGGIDCAGLVVMVARELGLGTYDAEGYRREPDGRKLLAHFAAAMDRIAIPTAGDGDVLLLRQGPMPCHAGILSTWHSRPHLIHAHSGRGKVCEDPLDSVLLDDRGQDARIAAFRFRGLEG